MAHNAGEACLNNAQGFSAVYMPAAVLILVLDNLFTGESVVQYVKYSTMVTLFLAAACKKIGSGTAADEHRPAVRGQQIFPGIPPAITGCKFTAFGGCFALAYICLIIANQKTSDWFG